MSEPELEEGVMCLMLLSRADRRSWEESNSVSEFSDNNSAILEPKPSHQNTPIVKDDEDENFVSKGYGGETSKMLLIEKGLQRSESSGQECGQYYLTYFFMLFWSFALFFLVVSWGKLLLLPL